MAFGAKFCPKMAILKRILFLSRRLMAAEEMLISLWRSQVTRHEELVEMVQYYFTSRHWWGIF